MPSLAEGATARRWERLFSKGCSKPQWCQSNNHASGLGVQMLHMEKTIPPKWRKSLPSCPVSKGVLASVAMPGCGYTRWTWRHRSNFLSFCCMHHVKIWPARFRQLKWKWAPRLEVKIVLWAQLPHPFLCTTQAQFKWINWGDRSWIQTSYLRAMGTSSLLAVVNLLIFYL